MRKEACTRKVSPLRRSCGRSERDINQKEARFRLLSDKVDKNRMAEAELEAELRGLQAGSE